MEKIVKDVLMYLWQLPQNLLGVLLIALYNDCRKDIRFNDVTIYLSRKMTSGISLGKYIIIHPFCASEVTIQHEYGHCLQSRKLGWFYLIVIGLPSLLGNIYDRLFHKNWDCEKSMKWYYNQPWERWADELGGVER